MRHKSSKKKSSPATASVWEVAKDKVAICSLVNVNGIRMQIHPKSKYVGIRCSRKRKGPDRCASSLDSGGGEETDTGMIHEIITYITMLHL